MDPVAFAFLAAGIGIFGATMAAGWGIGRLASAALEGTARQPEAANDIRTTMIIAAALIEGVAIIGEVVALVLIFAA